MSEPWFRRVIAGEGLSLVWCPNGDFQAAYDATASTRTEAFTAWQNEVGQARAFEAAAESWT